MSEPSDLKVDSRTVIEATCAAIAEESGLNPSDILIHVSRSPTQADWDALDPNSYETTCAKCGAYVVGQFGPDHETETPCGDCGSTEYTGGVGSPAGGLNLILREGW